MRKIEIGDAIGKMKRQRMVIEDDELEEAWGMVCDGLPAPADLLSVIAVREPEWAHQVNISTSNSVGRRSMRSSEDQLIATQVFITSLLGNRFELPYCGCRASN
jgi:hypothetical protein